MCVWICKSQCTACLQIETYDELLAGVHVYYTIHMSGEPVYFGLVSYNKNNKNILLGVINANGAKNFPHRRLYYTDRAGPILSAEE